MCIDIQVGADTLAHPERALPLEWVVSDGAGSYASSTALGCNTRRYHGLLVAALEPPRERAVLLSQLEEELRIGHRRYDFTTNEYPGAIHPSGYKHLVSFRLAPLPEWTFAAESGAMIRKKIVPLRGRGAIAIIYRLEGAIGEAELRVTPMAACRGFHQLLGPDANYESKETDGREIVISGGPAPGNLYLKISQGTFSPNPMKFRRVTYRRERERGFDFEEDLFSPGAFAARLERGRPLTLIVSNGAPAADIDPLREERKEESRIARLIEKAGAKSPLEKSLTVAADAFIVRYGESDGKGSVIAGFPWFDCWGRDALISLEGLTLVTRRFDDARAILAAFAERIRQGLAPNFLATRPEDDAFNSIDAALWFVHAAARYHDYTGDAEFLRGRIWPKIVEIIESYARGTRYNIGADSDGLVFGGARDTQLTWMDASADGYPVTPRHGKAVEINALWYNALRIAADLAGKFGMNGEETRYIELARRVEASFNEIFWDEELQCLLDGALPGHPDRRIRPNQVLAVSLPYPVLREDRRRQTMETVRRELLTPFGLRTLSPMEPEYRGEYAGPPSARDGAYHQGTAWTWLLGPFWEGYLKANGYSAESLDAARSALSVWPGHLLDAGLGSVSEIFDGDPPHTPRGCIAQAWSVAELLRLRHIIREKSG